MQRKQLQNTLQAAAPYLLEESQVGQEADWEERDKPNGTEAHNVTFCVTQKNVDKLHKILMEVSDPKSKKRGQYLTHNESCSLTANPESTQIVLEWLESINLQVIKVGSHGMYIRVQATISVWEEVLNTTFAYLQRKYRAESDNEGYEEVILRAVEDVYIPAGLREHISCAFGTTQLPLWRPAVSRASSSEPSRHHKSSNSTYLPITPERLRSFYKVTGWGSPDLSQAVLELGGKVSIQDFEDFQARYDNGAPKASFQDIGGHVVQPGEKLGNHKQYEETNLDVQYITAMAPSTKTIFWWVDSYEKWVEEICEMKDPPQVISISYGSLETKVAKSLRDHFNLEAMRLGSKGVTILVAAGDNGALTGVNPCAKLGKCSYGASFPATSPYVTAVGATMGGAQGGPEVACMKGVFSGGGFSKVFPGQPWQDSAVKKYFSIVTPKPLKGYNQSNRAFPDVAMPGNGYTIVIDGKTAYEDGTSAATPTFAGLVSLVNAQRHAAKQPAVGFLNPTLYEAGAHVYFNDITKGNNTCVKGADPRCCKQGYFATKGWDPVTGWGSITLPNLAALFARTLENKTTDE